MVHLQLARQITGPLLSADYAPNICELALPTTRPPLPFSRSMGSPNQTVFCITLKGALPVFLVNDTNCTDLNFSHFFCELGLKMLGPQQWQLVNLANEKNLS
jgi:hypothetical protein